MATARQFETYLYKLVEQLSPKAICEEHSEAQVLRHLIIDDNTYSIAKSVSANHNNIRHMYCDPNEDESDTLYSDNETPRGHRTKKMVGR